MLRDITFGKYYSTQSFVHRLDGRTNFIRFVVYMVSVMIIHNPINLIYAFLFLSLTIVLSKIPLSYILKGVWGVRFYIFLCIGLSLISDFSKQGLIKASILSAKLLMCVTSASMFTLTTSMSHISDTFEWLLSPLRVFRVPVHDVAVMLSIALRFMPVLADEADSIIQAQKARGADLGKGSLIRRVKHLSPLIIPIFNAAIRRASDLADALNTRAYGVYDTRTRLHPLKFKKNDVFTLMFIALYLGFMIWRNRNGC